MSIRSTAALLAVLAALAGCGLKGPLYLPEKSQEVVIRPAPGTAPEAAGETAPPEAPSDAEPPPTPLPDGSQTRPPGSGRG